MTTFTSTCPICETPFMNSTNPDGTPHQKTCSRKCGSISRGLITRTKRIPHTCPICGTTFADQPKRKRKYCSQECTRQGRRNTAKKVYPVCDFCGEIFEAPDPSNWTTVAPQRFCSKSCFGKGSASERGQHIRKEMTFTCIHCNKTFIRIKRYERKALYCSLSCYHARRRGVNHPNWQGGHDHYYGPDWETERLIALERDRYICQHCGVAQKQLIVHHIISRKAFNGNWHSANEPDNLITLCPSCHSRLHALEDNFLANPVPVALA